MLAPCRWEFGSRPSYQLPERRGSLDFSNLRLELHLAGRLPSYVLRTEPAKTVGAI